MRVTKGLIHRVVAGEHLLIPTGEIAKKHNGVFIITPIAGEIWDKLQDANEISDIEKILLERYDVSEEIIRQDMETFIKMLKENGLIQED